jgi:hypothetical protein
VVAREKREFFKQNSILGRVWCKERIEAREKLLKLA